MRRRGMGGSLSSERALNIRYYSVDRLVQETSEPGRGGRLFSIVLDGCITGSGEI